MSLARVLAAANKQARQSGVEAAENFITIAQRPVNGNVIWRINYSAKDSVGRRGGDLIVDVDASDGTISKCFAASEGPLFAASNPYSEIRNPKLLHSSRL